MKMIEKNKYRMLIGFSKYAFILIVSLVLISPVFAETCTGVDSTGAGIPKNCVLKTDTAGSGNVDTVGSGNGIVVTTGIKNPLSAEFGSDLPHFVEAIVNFVLLVGIPIIALAIIYSGFLFVMAQGNAEKLSKAKKTLLYTLIGAALLLGAFVVAHAIEGTVDAIKSSDTATGGSADGQAGK